MSAIGRRVVVLERAVMRAERSGGPCPACGLGPGGWPLGVAIEVRFGGDESSVAEPSSCPRCGAPTRVRIEFDRSG